jgi:protein-S-isoprenylcysteine O-methyltransferase Ste14
MSQVLLSLLWFVLTGALIFWPAGTLAYPGGWAFIIVLAGGGLAMTIWLAKTNPTLLRERLRSPVQRNQTPWDRIWAPIFFAMFIGWLAFMGWDARRTGFMAVPAWAQGLGALGCVAAMVGSWRTLRENPFAAPVVKIQEGHRVIDTGPYAVVRHPMYATALPMLAGMPLLLGSWWGFALSPILILGIAWRAVHEERTLRTQLKGYDEYAARVRYRFIPSVW